MLSRNGVEDDALDLWLSNLGPQVRFEGPGDYADAVHSTLVAGGVQPSWGLVDFENKYHPATQEVPTRSSGTKPIVLGLLALLAISATLVLVLRSPGSDASRPTATVVTTDPNGSEVQTEAQPPIEASAPDPEIARERALNATVHIETKNGSIGAGVILTKAGHVLTNAHVVGSETLVRVRQHNGQTRNGKVLARNVDADFAVLQILRVLETEKFEPVPIAGTAKTKSGDLVFAIGSPLGLPFSVARGNLAKKAQWIDGTPYLQANIRIFPGNSGGPLLNERFELLGVVTLKELGPRAFGYAQYIENAQQGDDAVLKPFLGATRREAAIDALWTASKQKALDQPETGLKADGIDGLLYGGRLLLRSPGRSTVHRRCPPGARYCQRNLEVVVYQLHALENGSHSPSNVVLYAKRGRRQLVVAHSTRIQVSPGDRVPTRLEAQLARLALKGKRYGVRKIRANFNGADIYRKLNANRSMLHADVHLKIDGEMTPKVGVF